MKAMILAAGFGTRLRPYSQLRPKPLFPVLGIPILNLHINQLNLAGFDAVVVNAHHLSDRIEEAITGLSGVVLQKEEKILGTGGGLRRALPELGGAPFLAINSDIFFDFDLNAFYEGHCKSGADATMVLHHYPRFNSVCVTVDGVVTGFGPEAQGPDRFLAAFTGIHVINPGIIKKIPAGEFYNIIDLYRDIITHGGTIRGVFVKNSYWADIGTPEDYLALHAYLLAGTRVEAMGTSFPGGPFHVGNDVAMGRGVILSDWVSIGDGARIGRDVELARSIVWPGAVIPEGAKLNDAIVV